jgi:hypothetical protein
MMQGTGPAARQRPAGTLLAEHEQTYRRNAEALTEYFAGRYADPRRSPT